MRTILVSSSVSANLIAFIVLGIIFVKASFKKRMSNRENDIFKMMMVFNMIQCILEPITLLIEDDPLWGVSFPTLLNTILYINNITFAFLWLRFSSERVHSDLRKSKYNWLSYLPAVCVYILMVVIIFEPIIFRIDPVTFAYERRGGFILTIILTYIYLASGVIIACVMRTRANKYLLGSSIAFIFPVFLASMIQFFVNGISVLWVGAAIGILIAYITIQEECFLVDVLTGLYTRQYVSDYIQEYMSGNRSSIMAGLMLDIDGFKNINDTYGHLVGDQAIVEFGAILRESIDNKSIAARFAGDEFVIIAMIDSEEDIKQIIQAIENNSIRYEERRIHNYSLKFSIGYTLCREKDTLDRFINRMDEAMYEQKAQRKVYR